MYIYIFFFPLGVQMLSQRPIAGSVSMCSPLSHKISPYMSAILCGIQLCPQRQV